MEVMHHYRTSSRNIPEAVMLCKRKKKIFINVKKRLVIYGSWKGGRLEGKESEEREYNIGMF